MIFIILGVALGAAVALQYIPGLDSVVTILQADLAKTFYSAAYHILPYFKVSVFTKDMISAILEATMPALIAFALFMAAAATENGRKIITSLIMVSLLVAFFFSPTNFALPAILVAALLVLSLVVVATKLLSFLFAALGTAISATAALSFWHYKNLSYVSSGASKLAILLHAKPANLSLGLTVVVLGMMTIGFFAMLGKTGDK